MSTQKGPRRGWGACPADLPLSEHREKLRPQENSLRNVTPLGPPTLSLVCSALYWLVGFCCFDHYGFRYNGALFMIPNYPFSFCSQKRSSVPVAKEASWGF